ncbi:Flagellar biosynthetic protein FliP [Arsenophonus endosymbiont of Aleurodicus floccissimus]|uniref:EscR/YscR/HrcR family type III secretion system export apparatus protein n=1 Tax=Arsenophonus endosymbiont of Aleurodicus floccissimus TaxID=2152761 RepID=UPI000E6B4185|nr:EscR/YscR/HrcR family type III secretion system export apparatus protein [Arsenophonus endosymbiont of Aleurodicus floccissimus]SPP32452.1 Flagellar biosynthetic protein FliP [Arsenophonus endosymbiont of Aleurodicus floccissimus]
MNNDISLITLLAFSALLPFIIATGTCYIKFSIVFIMARNALWLQQIPSNIVLNGVALTLSFFVLLPVVKTSYQEFNKVNIDYKDIYFIINSVNSRLGEYKNYLIKYSDKELVSFFDKLHQKSDDGNYDQYENGNESSITSLFPAYALSEIKSAFTIGFYLYLPFVVIDLLISSILLSLGIMMMSPVTISVPIKLILFIFLDGWRLLSKGLIIQYIELATG